MWKVTETYIKKWASGLWEMLDGQYSLKECENIARQKLRYAEKIYVKQNNNIKKMRMSHKLRNELYKEQKFYHPLPKVVSFEQADSIIKAYIRHTTTDYDDNLRKVKNITPVGFKSDYNVRKQAIKMTYGEQ